MTFGELIDGIGKNLGIELADEGGASVVMIDDNPVMLLSAGDDLLLLHADLGDIDPENREKVVAAAMEANFLYQGTGGATLAVDPRNGHLHLQKYNWLERIDVEKAVTDLARFADMVKIWKDLLSESVASVSSAADDMSAPKLDGFMQV